MSLRLGNNSEPSALYHGSDPVSRVYLGSQQVWPSTGSSVISGENVSETPVWTTSEIDNLSITFSSGIYAGTYTTDYQGNTFSLTDLQAAPVCVLAPVVSGNTGDGDALTITPGLWLYVGEDLGDSVFEQRLDDAAHPGGDGLTFVVDLAQYGGQSFTVAETYIGQTVVSNSVTIDGLTGSAMAGDINGLFWYDPTQVVLDGSDNFISWPNTANGVTGSEFNLDTVYGSAFPVWDVVNSKLVGNGVDQGVHTGTTGNNFTSNGGYSVFTVADVATGTDRTGSILFSYGEGNQYVYIGAGQSGGNLQIYSRDNSFADGIGWGQDPPLTMNSTVTANKHLFELRVTTETLVEIFVDGTLQWSDTITEANSLGTVLSFLSGGNVSWFSDAAIYEAFCTQSTGAILNTIRNELATKHNITLI